MKAIQIVDTLLEADVPPAPTARLDPEEWAEPRGIQPTERARRKGRILVQHAGKNYHLTRENAMAVRDHLAKSPTVAVGTGPNPTILSLTPEEAESLREQITKALGEQWPMVTPGALVKGKYPPKV